jgi:hypothetical protein
MPVIIHNNPYVTVAERVQALHADKKIEGKQLTITSEFLPNGEMVICKATVKIGENIFTGTSAANPMKAIEKQSPYEVAETSAIGRALGFAGYGIVEGIATADEIVKADKNGSVKASVSEVKSGQPNSTTEVRCVECGAIGKYHRPGCPNAI